MSREGFSQSRPFFGCFIGTLSPSRFHKRSTRLLFTRRRQAVFTLPIGASLRLLTRQPSGGSHTGRIAASVRSCLRPDVLRQHAPVALGVAWTGAGPEPGIHDAQKPSSGCAHDQCRPPLIVCKANDCRAAGRREGLRSFPLRPPSRSICPGSGQKPHAEGARSLSEDALVP